METQVKDFTLTFSGLKMTKDVSLFSSHLKDLQKACQLSSTPIAMQQTNYNVCIDMVDPLSAFNTAASRYGFVRFGLSSPEHAWTFGNNGIVNDSNPLPCSDSDSKDLVYLRKIIEFIETNQAQFDSKKMYAEGFS